MAASRKKVLLRTVSNTVHAGYLPASGLLADTGRAGARQVALLDLDARIQTFPLAEVARIAYVRDFNLEDKIDPERLSRRVFLSRPRTEGLWLRLALSSGDVLEGLAPLDIALADGLLEDGGLYLVPPDIRSNTQRIFVPRSAIAALEVVGVITTPSKAPAKATAARVAESQTRLFP